MQPSRRLDRPLLIIVGCLVIGGFFIFLSASLGLLAREGASFSSVAVSQIGFGIIGGLIALWFTSRVQYRFWKTYALHIFIIALGITSLVFIPQIGMTAGGASRWILLGPLSFQPAELLKVAAVLFTAAWLATRHRALTKPGWTGVVTLLGILTPIGILLFLQPDTGSFIIIATSVATLFFVSGFKWRDIGIILLIAIVGFSILTLTRPYILDRVTTFIYPAEDTLGAGYQVHQILIAVGSGEGFGRGFGQSVQKFDYLPQPIGDSIFAVAAEEFGFLGASIIIFLFLAFAFRSLRIAVHAPDYFGALVVIGITMLIVAQAFFNIAAMLGVVPLSGLPLVFISHGGTAMFVTLGALGIVLNISRYQKE